MVAGQRVPPPAARHGTPYHILCGAVMLDEIQIHRDEILDPMSQVPGQREGLQKNLRQQHGRADVEIYPAIPEVGDDGRQETEVPVARLSHGRPVTAGMHVNDVGPQGHVNRTGHVESRARREEAELKVWRPCPEEPVSDGATESDPSPHPLADRVVQNSAGLLGHPKLALGKLRLDVLRREARRGQLEIVDGAGPVQRDRRHHAAFQQVHQDGREAHLDDMGPHPQQDRFPVRSRRQDGLHHLAEALNRQVLRQGVEVGPQRSARPPGGRRVLHPHLAGARSQRIGRDLGKIQRLVAFDH